MSLVTANGVSVLGGSILMPLVGVWTADLVVDRADSLTAGASVSIEADGFTLKGTIAPERAGEFLDATHVRVIGGKGGLAKTAQPRSYAQPGAYVRDVLNGLAQDSGETFATTTDAAFLATNLVAWAVMAVPVSQAMATLLQVVAPDLSWRILPDGTLWIGSESWTSSGVQFEILEQDPTHGQYELGVESPSIAPGVELADVGKVSRVEHRIGDDGVRSHVWTSDTDRGIKSAVASLVKQAIPGIDYFALYDARVVTQSADGATVDLQPLDKRLPGFGRVRLKLGIPATVAKFAPGAIVRLGWDRGNPSLPFACLFDGGATLTTLEIAGNDKVLTATDFQTFLKAWNDAVVIANDGGASMRASTLTALAAASWLPGSSLFTLGSNKLKAGR
jgi:hypothetical protein